MQTTVLIGALLVHRLAGTFDSKVDAFIALTEFAKEKFIGAGFPEEKVFVKPNFVNMAAGTPNPEKHEAGTFALFVGRFAPEKGLETLLSAWEQIDYPIYLFGSGVLPEFKKTENINIMEFVDRGTILSQMDRASMLVFPSEWYEGFPLTIAEAFSRCLPVVTSNIGSQAEIVRDGYSGVHFEAGDVKDLRDKVSFLLQHPEEMIRMGVHARKEYELKYTANANYEKLMGIYEKVLSIKE
jgi:glycosyltransferase involved in cell wall biosynthesis